MQSSNISSWLSILIDFGMTFLESPRLIVIYRNCHWSDHIHFFFIYISIHYFKGTQSSNFSSFDLHFFL